MFNSIVINIIIFILGILLCLIKKGRYDNCKSKTLKKILKILSNDDFNGYFVNTIIAILGVTCAIFLTNYDTKQQEIKETIYFLEILCEELSNANGTVQGAINGLDEIDALEKGTYREGIIENIKDMVNDPIPALDILLTDSPYSSTISIDNRIALLNCRTSINIFKNGVHNATDIGEIKLNLEWMSFQLRYAYKIVEIECKYQKNEIGREDIDYEMYCAFVELCDEKGIAYDFIE